MRGKGLQIERKLTVKNKFITLFLTCLLGAGFSACTGSGKPASTNAIDFGSPNSPGSPESTLPGASAQAQPQQGTGDSGGGNLYKGRPLESYIKDPQILDVTKKYINPILAWLPNSVGKVMSQTLRAKNWYFVPGPLEDLPKEKIGSVVQVEQGALQDFTQVWIDQDRFEQMSEVEKAQLIIHELLMGIKLLKFDSPNHACVMNQVLFLNSRYTPRLAELTSCNSLSKSLLGKISDLSAADYSQIRDLASTLIQKILILESESDHSLKWWVDDIGPKGVNYFRAYNETQWLTLFSAGNFSFQQTYIGRILKLVDAHETIQMMERSFKIGYKLTYGFNVTTLDNLRPNWRRAEGLSAIEGTWESNTSCEFKLDRKSQFKFEISLKMGDEIKNFSLSADNDGFDGTAERNFFFNGEILERRTLFLGQPKAGNKRDRLFVYLDLTNRVRFVEFSELLREGSVDEEVNPSHYTWQDNYLKGPLYLCGMDSQIQLTRNKTN